MRTKRVAAAVRASDLQGSLPFSEMRADGAHRQRHRHAYRSIASRRVPRSQGQELSSRLALLESISAWNPESRGADILQSARLTGGETMRPRFAVLLFALTFSSHAQAQEGHLGAGHDKWHQSFLQRLAAARGQRLVLQPHRLPSDVRPHGRRSLRGQSQWRLDFRSSEKSNPSIRAGRRLPRLRPLQLQGQSRGIVLRDPGAGGLATVRGP
jgi:hypothetical protein